MAVKKNEVVKDPRQLDLSALAKYLQLLHTHYLSNQDLVKNCLEIIKCLARTPETCVDMWDSLQIVRDFLVRVTNTVQDEVRHEIITVLMNKFNQYTSDPQSNAGGATSVVLVVLNSENDVAQSTARWLVQQGEGLGTVRLRSSLSCLYCWLCEWNGTPTLGDWVITYINALEDNGHFDILIEVSLNNIVNLFSALDEPNSLPQSSANAILHVLSALRTTKEALDMIAPHIDRVLNNLASDSGPCSRQLLEYVVDILAEVMYGVSSTDDTGFKNKYSDVISCLELHMASRGCSYLQLPPWRARNLSVKPTNPRKAARRVGLTNLGNTCYMNSIIQALLLTRQFSNHVMMEMGSAPYWAKLGALFATMLYSFADSLNPKDYLKIFKPPYFTNNNQHDSSEFLVYLLELLQSFENCSEENFDYKKPMIPAACRLNNVGYRLRNSTNQGTSSGASDFENPEPGPYLSSIAARPGGSDCGSSSGISKRLMRNEGLPPKKRMRMLVEQPPALRRESYIDSMFSGVMKTRVECTECHSSSFSQDVFRDLQLSFPERPEGFQYTVQNLLEYYCSVERLTGDNRYRCRKCGVLRDAERRVQIETPPKYLIIVLKNFKFNPKSQMQTKLMHNMVHDYTITLPTVCQTVHSSYALYAAVIHSGTTLDSGHYYTLAKNNNSWFAYNDEIVTEAHEADINDMMPSNTAYVLFYRRTDIEESPVPTLEELPGKIQEHVISQNKKLVMLRP